MGDYALNYERIYGKLCAVGGARLMSGAKKQLGYEDHHITPRCLGGSNEKLNIARLTSREHFLAHRLLAKMHPSAKGLRFAVWRMANAQAKGKLNSREYAALRKWYAETKRQELVQRNADPVFLAAKRVRSARVMATLNPYVVGALGTARLTELRGDPAFAAEHRANHEAAVAAKVKCVETEFTFDSLTKAALWLRTQSYPNARGNKIGMCCAGKIKRAYGYTWQYA